MTVQILISIILLSRLKQFWLVKSSL